MFLACCVLPDKKLYGNHLYWCKYIRDINGAMQRLKATVPDRRVWLPAHALAVRLNNAFKGAKQSPRPCGPLLPKTAPLWKWNTHSKCMCQCAYTYCIVFVYCDCTMYSTVRYSYKCSQQNTFQVLNTSIVICNTGPYYTSRHQGWSKLHTAFTKLTSKFPYLRQSAKIWR